jgi:hypothetical protein
MSDTRWMDTVPPEVRASCRRMVCGDHVGTEKSGHFCPHPDDGQPILGVAVRDIAEGERAWWNPATGRFGVGPPSIPAAESEWLAAKSRELRELGVDYDDWS